MPGLSWSELQIEESLRQQKSYKTNRTRQEARHDFLLNIEQRSSERLSPSLLGSATQMIASQVSSVRPGVYGLPDELCGVVVPGGVVLPELLPLGVSAPPIAELPPDRPKYEKTL